MGKKIAIKGHPTRGKEIIELLKMLGGDNRWKASGEIEKVYYSISNGVILYGPQIVKDTVIFTLEEFLEKYPFKIGDKVIDKADGCPGIVNEMKWDEDVSDMKYFVAFGNDIDFGWFANDSIEFCKETDTVKPVTNKSERTHEDVIFDSIIWHLRNSVNNGKQNLSGGECEDYFREVVKKNNENKMSDCKKCGLGFGSVRCFDKDCPHNTPKSYAVGLKDGKVIECGVNKEIVMNEIKPLFKIGDVVKLKGCPDKNIFWIVMDVIENGYIFNSGEKCSFDDQHHYEKTNREVINTQPNITDCKIAYLSINNEDYADQIEVDLGDNYEYKFEMNRLYIVKKKPIYPTTYEECCEIIHSDPNFYIDTHLYSGTLEALYKLLICRTAYWKIAGEKMGLGKPWKPDWSTSKPKYVLACTCNGTEKQWETTYCKTFAFPSAEMRDAFYENFKDLIEQCKELL